jgi:hypothetical protein
MWRASVSADWVVEEVSLSPELGLELDCQPPRSTLGFSLSSLRRLDLEKERSCFPGLEFEKVLAGKYSSCTLAAGGQLGTGCKGI